MGGIRPSPLQLIGHVAPLARKLYCQLHKANIQLTYFIIHKWIILYMYYYYIIVHKLSVYNSVTVVPLISVLCVCMYVAVGTTTKLKGSLKES